MNIAELTTQNLERLSQNWDNRTVELLLFLEGSGNMFGGSSNLAHIIVHGENSVKETGLIEIKGVAIESRNYARGANGPSRQTVKYFKGITDYAQTRSAKPTYEIAIEGTAGGGEEALCVALSCKGKEWLIKK